MMILTKFSAVLLAGFLCALPITAQTIVASHTIRSKSVIDESDLLILTKSVPGSYSTPDQVAGMEARVILYPGRPIRPSDIGPPAVIERNEIVTLTYNRGALWIVVEGRALGRGGIGERIRVMNLSSRTTVSGIVASPGDVRITP